jgi:hypothetical protein
MRHRLDPKGRRRRKESLISRTKRTSFVVFNRLGFVQGTHANALFHSPTDG